MSLTGEPRLYNSTTASKYLGIHVRSLRRLVAQGHLRPFGRVGNQLRFKLEDLDRYVQGRNRRPE